MIADGVQSIPDEFLEWFVNNSSCEEIKVITDKKLSSKSIYDAVEGDLVYSLHGHHGHGGIINSLSEDVRVGIDNYVETAITSETGWETLDINNYKIYDKCYEIIIPKEEPKQGSMSETIKQVINNKLQEEPRQEKKRGITITHIKKQETLEDLTEQIQNECHSFVESVPNVTYQDATNTFLFMKLADLTLKLRKFEK